MEEKKNKKTVAKNKPTKKELDKKHLEDIADGYYSFKRLISKHPECLYYIIYGERSNGKSYSILEYMLEEFYNSEFTKSFGYLRRWKEDITYALLNQVFKSLKKDDLGRNRVKEITKNRFNTILAHDRCFWLGRINDDTGELEEEYTKQPFGYIFSLSASERIKSTGYPDIYYIFFEEFISEGLPMVNEFSKFRSVLSTIIRNDDKVKIILAGNTINKHNIYFNEFGFTSKIKYQQPNTIDVYKYEDPDTLDEFGKPSILYIACEFADFPNRKLKKSNIYFAFNREKNKMIRNGAWDIGEYPHLEYFYTPADIKLIYFIKFEDEIFQAEVIKVKDIPDNRILYQKGDICSKRSVCFTYIHKKTSAIKEPYKHIIFQKTYDSHNNIRQDIMNAYDDIGKFIKSFYITSKVFYQDNIVGDMINAFMGNI